MSELHRSGRHALDKARTAKEFPTEPIPVIVEPGAARQPSWIPPVIVLAAVGVIAGGALVVYRSNYVTIGAGCAWVAATGLVLYWNSRVRNAAELRGRARAQVELRNIGYQLDQAQRSASALKQENDRLRGGLANADRSARNRWDKYAELLRDLHSQAANRWPAAAGAARHTDDVPATASAGARPDDDPVIASIAALRDLLGALAVPATSGEIAPGSTPDPGFRQVLVDVGRRTQDFAHRAIEELDELIHRISDPELLRYSFAIDHLLSRLRRVSENLILIDGPTAPRQWRQPVTLLSALRQAKAEIDHYDRVQLVRPIPGTVLGHVVVPLAHLVAELLENAANYSKPESGIKLRGRYVTAGIAVSVDDEGFGMSDATLDRANELLNTDNDVTTLVREGRLVGLWVVANIARMYGMRVELSRNIFGGTTASVVIPPALIHEPADVDDGQPAASARGPAVPTEAAAVSVVDTVDADRADHYGSGQPGVYEAEPAEVGMPGRAGAEPRSGDDGQTGDWPTDESPDTPGGEESIPEGALPPLPKRPPGTASMASQLRTPATTTTTTSPAPAASPAIANFLLATQAIRAEGTAQLDSSDDGAHPGDSQGDPHHNAR